MLLSEHAAGKIYQQQLNKPKPFIVDGDQLFLFLKERLPTGISPDVFQIESGDDDYLCKVATQVLERKVIAIVDDNGENVNNEFKVI